MSPFPRTDGGNCGDTTRGLGLSTNVDEPTDYLEATAGRPGGFHCRRPSGAIVPLDATTCKASLHTLGYLVSAPDALWDCHLKLADLTESQLLIHLHCFTGRFPGTQACRLLKLAPGPTFRVSTEPARGPRALKRWGRLLRRALGFAEPLALGTGHGEGHWVPSRPN